jgi:hypothetical protein
MQVKRLHDSGLSAIWVLLHCIPSIGSIILIILLCRKTQLHDNEYGPIPEEIARNHNLYTYEETPVTKGNSTLEKSSNPNETNEEFAEEKDSQQHCEFVHQTVQTSSVPQTVSASHQTTPTSSQHSLPTASKKQVKDQTSSLVIIIQIGSLLKSLLLCQC